MSGIGCIVMVRTGWSIRFQAAAQQMTHLAGLKGAQVQAAEDAAQSFGPAL